jgi:hypothetical protein
VESAGKLELCEAAVEGKLRFAYELKLELALELEWMVLSSVSILALALVLVFGIANTDVGDIVNEYMSLVAV